MSKGLCQKIFNLKATHKKEKGGGAWPPRSTSQQNNFAQPSSAQALSERLHPLIAQSDLGSQGDSILMKCGTTALWLRILTSSGGPTKGLLFKIGSS